jgi:hypothetical protein
VIQDFSLNKKSINLKKIEDALSGFEPIPNFDIDSFETEEELINEVFGLFETEMGDIQLMVDELSGLVADRLLGPESDI